MAVDHWRSYLQPAPFVIQTDQRSLVHLDDQRLSSFWQQKALTKLMCLQYKICYKKGSTNNAADALSRISPHPDLELHAMSTAQPIWLADLQNSYLNCSQAKQLLTELSLKPVFHHFSLVQGVIKSKGRIWLGHMPPLQQQVMQALHSSPIGGHSGALVTHIRIKKLFYWPLMKKHIQEFVTACIVCQQAKSEKVAYPGLL